MREHNFTDMFIVHFFQVEPATFFRYNEDFWQRLGANDATSSTTGETKNFGSITPVGIFKNNLMKGVVPLKFKR